jgi:hypothetical protein
MVTVKVLKVCLDSAPKIPAGSGYCGFTTYLKRYLMNNVAYVCPVARRGGGGRLRVQRGLVLGRRLDSEFRNYARGTGGLNGSVVTVLRRRGIRLVDSQTTIWLPHVGVKTPVDGIGVDAAGCVWVVELKNTQQTVAEHRASYALPCPNNTHLRNGMINSECVRYSLQAGFGVAGFRRAHPTLSVRGIVIVNCSDGACGYAIDTSTYAAVSAFPPNVSDACAGGRWDDTDRILRRLVSNLGYKGCPMRRTARGTVGVYRRPDGKRLAISVGRGQSKRLRSVHADVRAIVVCRRGGLATETL